MFIVTYIHTYVYVRIEARASISFQAILTRPLFEPGFYSSPASIKVHGNFISDTSVVSNTKSVVFRCLRERASRWLPVNSHAPI